MDGSFILTGALGDPYLSPKNILSGRSLNGMSHSSLEHQQASEYGDRAGSNSVPMKRRSIRPYPAPYATCMYHRYLNIDGVNIIILPSGLLLSRTVRHIPLRKHRYCACQHHSNGNLNPRVCLTYLLIDSCRLSLKQSDESVTNIFALSHVCEFHHWFP